MGRIDSLLVGLVVALAWLLVAAVRGGGLDAEDLVWSIFGGAAAAVAIGRVRPTRGRHTP
jgi:hypothetical protein